MTLYFVAGEASADNHAAALMSALRERDATLNFIGRGGPAMRAIAGKGFKDWLGDAAVLGLWEVLRKYGYFRKQFRETLEKIQENKPDAVVLIDYPGFNLRLARALRRNIDVSSMRPAGILPAESGSTGSKPSERTGRRPMFRGKIIYYISPQVWAWSPGRITKMAACLDLMLCIFPFEADLYNQAGLRTIFVGHPMLERLRSQKINVERDPNLIGLFPGSRLPEVRKIFPVMLESARELRGQHRDLRFEVAAASHELANELEKMRDEASQEEQLIQIKVGETTTIMQRASVGIVASGSATLEAAYFRLPFVLIYKVAWPTYLAARLVVKVKYLGMPNVLAEREIVPEFIQHQARPDAIAKAVWQLMENADARQRMISDLETIVGKLGTSKASEMAAGAILEEIGRST